jgi:hypothetical protein
VPISGPAGSLLIFACECTFENQSEHHSHTFPDTLYKPNPFGENAYTGAVET